jgi:hypothetical protein
MEENIKENGLTITWKVLVFTHGKMEDAMKESIKMIRKMAMAFILGVINVSIKVGGLEANSMA